jgi:hypothetical protein
MSEEVTYVLAMTCLLPAIAGICRYKKMQPEFRPLVYMMVFAVLLETVLYVAKKYGYIIYALPVVNLYMLLNLSFFLYFVKINRYINEKMMRGLLFTAIAILVFNYIYEAYNILKVYYYLMCFVSLVMLIIVINILSRQTMVVKYKLVNNFWFWFSSFSIIYNAFTLLIFGLYFFAMSDSPKGKAIGVIHHFVNAVCYLFFTLAIFKIPKNDKKHSF